MRIVLQPTCNQILIKMLYQGRAVLKEVLLLKNKSILYVEDDRTMSQETTEILGMLFKSVYTAQDGLEAVEIFNSKKPDIILTDIKMPHFDGVDLVQYVRSANYGIPIVLLTAFMDEKLLLSAANLSVDGYIIKPVVLEKLATTLTNALRRSKNSADSITLGEGLAYNLTTKELTRDGKVITLGTKENYFLELLIKTHPATLTKERILNEVYSFSEDNGAVIKSLVLHLRKKIGQDAVVSVRGVGYRLGNKTQEIKIDKQ